MRLFLSSRLLLLYSGVEGYQTHIDAISAIETIEKPIPTAVARNTIIAPPVPPFVNGMITVLVMRLSISQMIDLRLRSMYVKIISHVSMSIID